jgi:hypothetical protein
LALVVYVIRASVELHKFDWYVTVGSGMGEETELSHSNDITKCIIMSKCRSRSDRLCVLLASNLQCSLCRKVVHRSDSAVVELASSVYIK